MSSNAFGDGIKTTQHSLLDNKTMNMCESYLIKTYLKSPEQVLVGALG